MVFCSLIASSAIRAFISALKLRRCLDFISARFPRQRFYTLMSGPNFGEHFTLNQDPQTTIGSEADALRRSRHNPALLATVDDNIGKNFSDRSVMQRRAFHSRRPRVPHNVSCESFQSFVEPELQLPPQHHRRDFGGLVIRNRKDTDYRIKLTLGAF